VKDKRGESCWRPSDNELSHGMRPGDAVGVVGRHALEKVVAAPSTNSKSTTCCSRQIREDLGHQPLSGC